MQAIVTTTAPMVQAQRAMFCCGSTKSGRRRASRPMPNISCHANGLKLQPRGSLLGNSGSSAGAMIQSATLPQTKANGYFLAQPIASGASPINTAYIGSTSETNGCRARPITWNSVSIGWAMNAGASVARTAGAGTLHIASRNPNSSISTPVSTKAL